MPGAIRITLAIEGDVQLDRTLARFQDHLTDARPLWEDLADMFAAGNLAQFGTEGAASSGGWAKLSPGYAAWKSHVRPGRPLLVFDGDLRRSLTERPFGVERITGDSLTVGTDVPYARFHQRGIPGRLPRRRPVELTEAQRRAWVKRIQTYAVKGH